MGFWAVVEERFAPLQLNIFAPPEGFAVSKTEFPPHIGPLLLGDATGVAFTVTVVV